MNEKRAELPTERPDNGLVLYPNFKELGLFRIDSFTFPCYITSENVISGLAVCAKKFIKMEKYVKLLTLLSTILLIINGCSPKVYPVQRDTVTQVRTEIVERLVRDTVEVTLPQDSVYVQTRDTASVLRIKTAISEASVSKGILYHSLYSDPDFKPEIEVIYKDRVEYRDTTIVSSNTEVIEVEKRLNSWQKAMMSGGYILLGAVVLLVVLGILKWRKVI